MLSTTKISLSILFFLLFLGIGLYDFGSKKSYGVEVQRELSDEIFMGSDHAFHKLSEFKGSFLFLYAGYTGCGLICGRSMQTLNKLAKNTHFNIKFIFLSIDPQNDSFDKLEKFLIPMGNQFLALRKQDGSLGDLGKNLEIQFSENLFDKDKNHTDSLFLADKTGKLRFIYPSNLRKEDRILEDLVKLENEND